MTIKKVSYSKTYPISNMGIWEKIFLEADINEGEDVRKTLYELKRHIENFHFESNKSAEKVASATIASLSIGNIANDITTCGDLKILESYSTIVKNKPELQTIYDQQYKKLTT